CRKRGVDRGGLLTAEPDHAATACDRCLAFGESDHRVPTRPVWIGYCGESAAVRGASLDPARRPICAAALVGRTAEGTHVACDRELAFHDGRSGTHGTRRGEPPLGRPDDARAGRAP